MSNNKRDDRDDDSTAGDVWNSGKNNEKTKKTEKYLYMFNPVYRANLSHSSALNKKYLHCYVSRLCALGLTGDQVDMHHYYHYLLVPE